MGEGVTVKKKEKSKTTRAGTKKVGGRSKNREKKPVGSEGMRGERRVKSIS